MMTNGVEEGIILPDCSASQRLCCKNKVHLDKYQENTTFHHMASATMTVRALARRRGVLRARDLSKRGIPTVTLTRLVRAGALTRLGRGLYELPDREVSAFGAFAEVTRRDPKSVICLLSALRFHGLTTQAPADVWIALPNKAHFPQSMPVPIRVVRVTGSALSEGIERHRIDGVPVRVTTVARTVVDCFKFRSTVGLDVALEALREAWHARRVTMDELWTAASRARMANVMRPYLESLV
jgi:predicted transcriptional regulator of viral defense system